MLILFFKAQQFGLFEEEVPVAGHVTKRGTVVAPYRAKRKKKQITKKSEQEIPAHV